MLSCAPSPVQTRVCPRLYDCAHASLCVGEVLRKSGMDMQMVQLGTLAPGAISGATARVSNGRFPESQIATPVQTELIAMYCPRTHRLLRAQRWSQGKRSVGQTARARGRRANAHLWSRNFFQCHLTPPPSSKLVCAASRSVIACDHRSFVRLYELDGSRRSARAGRATADRPP